MIAKAKLTIFGFTLDGNVLINDSRVEMTDIYASNGVIHVVDKVFLPN